MNRNLLLIAFCFQILFASSQSFLNGDFEMNTSMDCDYNLTDSVFNKKMSNVHAFGKKFTFSNKHKGEMDILTTGCYVDPYNGNWCIGLGVDSTTDAVAIELNSNLEIGQLYQLKFYAFGNTTFFSTIGNIMIGESLTDSTFGNYIDSITPISMNWKEVNLKFIASQTSKYITVKNTIGISGWNQIDHFRISKITATNYVEFSKLRLFPNPTSGLVTVQANEFSQLVSIRVINTMGEIVYNTKNAVIDLSNLRSGLYFLELTTNKGKYITQLIRE